MDKDSLAVFLSAEKEATSDCFSLAKRFLLAAEIQISRIWEKPVSGDENPLLPYEMKLIDIHFYFIALRNLYRHLGKVVADPVYADLKPELEELNEKWFKHYAQGRECFEHIDQRFNGEKHEEKIVEVEQNGAKRKIHFGLSFKDGLFAHSDQSWDITSTKFDEIKASVEHLMGHMVDASNKD